MAAKPARTALIRPLLYSLLAVTLFAALGPIAGITALAQQGDEPAPKPAEPQSLTEKLGGSERYLTHLSTDKPIYRAGETVFVRGTVLHAFTQKPFKGQVNQANHPDARRRIMPVGSMPMVEIKDPKGITVASGPTAMQDSVIGFTWKVPQGQAGGEYTVKVTHPWTGLAPAERTFDIRAYRPPRIKTQIEFLKDGYGPGDTVVATLDATRAEGGVPEGAKVTAIARVDGQEVARVQTMVRETGSAVARFELPGQIKRGEGSVAFVIEDGGVVETATKTLPILLQTVDLSVYPEGGDLVAGVENRVYFEARTPYGKPADLKGKLMVIDGKVHGTDHDLLKPIGVKFETIHEGRGQFSFTPEAGKQYKLFITEPSSVTQTIDLPKAVTTKAALSVANTVIKPGDPVVVELSNIAGLGPNGNGEVVVRQREKRLTSHRYAFLSGKQAKWAGETNNNHVKLQLPIEDDVAGILAVTVYDADGNPVAERLVYRQPATHVNIEIVPDSAQYTPAGKVQLTLKTTDQDGKPVSAVAGLTVTDDAVLEMIETREQAPSLPAMVFLEQEVRELMDAHVYLDPNNAEAKQQLDLLLGTQGWRRFAVVNMADFIREHGDDARRLLALRVPVRAELLKAETEIRRNWNAVRGGGPVPGELLEGVDFEVADGALADPGQPVPKSAPVPPVTNAPNIVTRPDVDPADLQASLEESNKLQAAEQRLFNIEAQSPQREAALDRADFAYRQSVIHIREYAHKQPEAKPLGERSDFTETVYWSASTKTDDKGLATVEFDLSDSVTSFRVKADAFTKSGALGAGSELIESVRPFYIEPKLPLELTEGDVVQVPIAMVNNTNGELPVELTIGKLGKAGKDTMTIDALRGEERGRAFYRLAIGKKYGELPFKLSATAGPLRDVNHRKLKVVPNGFPFEVGNGGMLEPDSKHEHELVIPETAVPGSLSVTIAAYPTPLANLTDGLKRLIREPYGCFEQTSSTTYPLVMAQQYFMTHPDVDPSLIADAREKLSKGYNRLLGFETPEKGYDWYGKAPGHEGLTAYGLLQFSEMKQVMEVDQAMINRTADWLMSRRDSNGSFTVSNKKGSRFGAGAQDTADAYITWALLEAGYNPGLIQNTIDKVLANAQTTDDMYIVALAANIASKLNALGHEGSFQSVGYAAQTKQLLDKLVKQMNEAGYVEGAVTSLVRSGGNALKIETTAIAVLAWLQDDAYTAQVEQSMKWITEQCQGGRFGSTQSTVLALKAIVEYDKARSKPKAPGSLVVLVDGKPVGEPVAINPETKGTIHLPDIHHKLTPGKHTVAIQMNGGSEMPYAITADYFATKPASSDDCKLQLELGFEKVRPFDVLRGAGPEQDKVNNVGTIVREGEVCPVRVRVTNKNDKDLTNPIAIIGLPGGLEPDFDQLKELVKAGTIATFEVRGREVILYWRGLEANQSLDFSIRCIGAVPGSYTGPASRVYEYYTDEHKHWADPLKVMIVPRGN